MQASLALLAANAGMAARLVFFHAPMLLSRMAGYRGLAAWKMHINSDFSGYFYII